MRSTIIKIQPKRNGTPTMIYSHIAQPMIGIARRNSILQRMPLKCENPGIMPPTTKPTINPVPSDTIKVLCSSNAITKSTSIIAADITENTTAIQPRIRMSFLSVLFIFISSTFIFLSVICVWNCCYPVSGIIWLPPTLFLL